MGGLADHVRVLVHAQPHLPGAVWDVRLLTRASRRVRLSASAYQRHRRATSGSRVATATRSPQAAEPGLLRLRSGGSPSADLRPQEDVSGGQACVLGHGVQPCPELMVLRTW